MSRIFLSFWHALSTKLQLSKHRKQPATLPRFQPLRILSTHYSKGVGLLDTDLYVANLRGANLRGANLQKVKGLTEEQIQSARIDEYTKLPPYLKRPGPTDHDAAASPQEGTTPHLPDAP